jgi:hypothetical protein
MKKILFFFIVTIIICGSVSFFYTIYIDRASGTINISSRIRESGGRSFSYRLGGFFRKVVDALNGISITDLHEEISDKEDSFVLPFLKGEQLKFDVYSAGLKTGESVLTFHGEKDLGNERVYYITFSTELPFFKDYEEIYACINTFLPVKIDRRIIKLGGLSTEHIEEIYDQDKFTVSISKRRKISGNTTVIRKDGPIYNAILLTYYYRANPRIAEKGALKVVLPTQEFSISVLAEDEIETPSGRYLADVFTSEPSKFTFYLSKDAERLPLKIESHTALKYTLILNSKDIQS